MITRVSMFGLTAGAHMSSIAATGTVLSTCVRYTYLPTPPQRLLAAMCKEGKETQPLRCSYTAVGIGSAIMIVAIFLLRYVHPDASPTVLMLPTVFLMLPGSYTVRNAFAMFFGGQWQGQSQSSFTSDITFIGLATALGVLTILACCSTRGLSLVWCSMGRLSLVWCITRGLSLVCHSTHDLSLSAIARKISHLSGV